MPSAAACQRASALLRWIARKPTPVVAEVGVLVGDMSQMLLRGHSGLRLYMIDSWSADPSADYQATRDMSARSSADDHARFEKRARAVAARYAPRAKIVKQRSVDAAATFSAEMFDCVFIDADHSERAVRADISAWAPKVRCGGILGGHDYRNHDPRFDFTGVDRAVDETFGDKVIPGDNFTWWVRM